MRDLKVRPIIRAVASLTVPGGQEFHFPHFFLKFQSIFPQTLLIFFLILALRLGDSPTREGPGYATAYYTGLLYNYDKFMSIFCICKHCSEISKPNY